MKRVTDFSDIRVEKIDAQSFKKSHVISRKLKAELKLISLPLFNITCNFSNNDEITSPH
jgi:hypothetical protein